MSTQIKECPIIFNTAMVQAILNGSKSQSRRVIKPQPFRGALNATAEHPSYGWFWKKLYQTWDGEDDFFRRLAEYCPYGQAGQRLWVKETWATDKMFDAMSAKQIEATGVAIIPLWYKCFDNQLDREGQVRGRWRSSRFMPRWASRITLEIKEVKVERLNQITNEDAKAEGVIPMTCCLPGAAHYITPFRELWDSLNAKKYPWSSNPWLWVIGFKKI